MVAHSSSLLCSVLTVDAMGFPAVCFSPYDAVSRQCGSRLPEGKRCWVLLRSCQPCISDSDLLLHRLFVPRTVTWLFVDRLAAEYSWHRGVMLHALRLALSESSYRLRQYHPQMFTLMWISVMVVIGLIRSPHGMHTRLPTAGHTEQAEIGK